ncbi:hypothetical protein BY996DRAFT_6425870 [Phakopsora pachyrhizi]|nr:hypothetical protein BY996DRAFT_6425870 [Phakopsora pachyrhizi]
MVNPIGPSVNRTWTETSTFELIKYSRSRHCSLSSSQSENLAGANRSSQGASEWTHFNQPKLSLVIQTTKTDYEAQPHTADSAIKLHQNIVLKVLWNNTGLPLETSGHSKSIPRNGNETDGIFEQVDLNEVSERFSTSRLGEVPLKAVCRDSLAGVRYASDFQAESTAGTSDILNYKSTEFRKQNECLKFIEKIESICPCRIGTSSSQEIGIRTNPSQISTEIYNSKLISEQSTARHSLTGITCAQESSIGNKVLDIQGRSSSFAAQCEERPYYLNKKIADHESYPQILNKFIGASQAEGTNQDHNFSEKSFNFGPEPLYEAEPIDDTKLKQNIHDILLDPGFEDFVKYVKSLIDK